jgi:two-component system chemotaxis response regulator CheB
MRSSVVSRRPSSRRFWRSPHPPEGRQPCRRYFVAWARGFRCPLVAQHIARGFVSALVEWLNTTVPLRVKIACQGERLLPGHVYLAPEDRHILTSDPGFASQRPASATDRFCPSADLLFESVARTYGASAIGLVMTGMGDDGTRGLLSLRSAGAPTLGQDAASCVVYGMPRAALEAGAIALVESLAALPDTILKIVSSIPRNGGAT